MNPEPPANEPQENPPEEGRFPDSREDRRRKIKENLRKLWRRNRSALFLAAAVIIILTVAAIFATRSSINTTREAVEKVKMPAFNMAGRDSAATPPTQPVDPSQTDPDYQLFKACRANPQLCGGQAQAQKPESKADQERQQLAAFRWKARFTPPDGGKGYARASSPAVSPDRPDESVSVAPEPKPADKPKSDVTFAPYSQADGPKYQLFGGVTQISARLVNKLTAEITGPVIAMVNEDVWSWGREEVLVPKGTYLTGNYERVNADSQERVQVKLDSMLMPDGFRVNFPTENALDQTGESGLHDKVDRHLRQIFLTSIALSGIGAGAQVGGGYASSPVGLLRVGFGQGMSEAATRVLDRARDRNPTLTIRAGVVLNFFAPVDMPLPAWENHRMNPHI